jgi:membrane-bound ClpP family serine protease
LELFVPIALVVTGLALIIVEVYLVPGFNVVGIFGFLMIFFGVGYAFFEVGTVGGLATLLGAVAAIAGSFYWMWQSGAWDRFVLSTSLRADEDSVDEAGEHRARYLGRSGVAVTPLRPTGVADIDGERIEVVTEGEFIASGSRVRVVAMDRRRYFVRLADVVSETPSV